MFPNQSINALDDPLIDGISQSLTNTSDVTNIHEVHYEPPPESQSESQYEVNTSVQPAMSTPVSTQLDRPVRAKKVPAKYTNYIGLPSSFASHITYPLTACV